MNKKNAKNSIDAMKDHSKITTKMVKKKLMETKHKNFMDNGKLLVLPSLFLSPTSTSWSITSICERETDKVTIFLFKGV